jgi:ubiquinone/menaquinone biosynthesis C-methylase UbiE
MSQTSDSANASNVAEDDFRNKVEGFAQPTQLPSDDAQRQSWQAANRAWWESTPMRYDWREAVGAEPGTAAYFAEIDARFLGSVRKYLPWKRQPFEQLIDYDALSALDVLEIGVGQGAHAQLIASHAKSFTGIDLTVAASTMTARRLSLMGLPGRVLQMDAEAMTFPDASFDYVWSWGVIHHSADTRRVLTEMRRVLRPGGRATVMVYHRSWLHFHLGGYLRGVFQGQFKRLGTLHRVSQGATDGAIARFYTTQEWRETTAGLFEVEKVRILGLKAEILPLPRGRLKSAIEALTPDAVSRLITNGMRLGTFLVADMRRV